MTNNINNVIENVNVEEMNGGNKMRDKSNLLNKKVDIVGCIEVKYSNPNGDPDTGAPRVDFRTGYGFITDVCLKSLHRSTMSLLTDEKEGYGIYIGNGEVLNRVELNAYKKFGINSAEDVKKLKKDDPKLGEKTKGYLCDKYYDIRAFGGVMTKAKNYSLSDGQIKGAVQFTFAESVDPVSIYDLSITRKAIATEEDALKKDTEMGGKSVVPYGIYRFEVHISANQAQKNGFTEEDYELFLTALKNMYEDNLSASRSNVTVRDVFVFEHSSKFGDCQAYKLNESINVKKKDDVIYPRSYKDYEVSIDTSEIPDTVTVRRL